MNGIDEKVSELPTLVNDGTGNRCQTPISKLYTP